ncbi:MAG: PhpK family radical SAM P-methyltransferase [Myxococcales bacterium]|nr:PhpK family radical SAM P-methyltransferase [Myxococcales bacterium]
MADCLILGFNDLDFSEHEQRVRKMGTRSGAYRDLDLSFVWYEGRPHRALDLLNTLRLEEGLSSAPLHNAEFLWPVILVLGTKLHRRGHTFDYVNLPHLEGEQLSQKLAAPDLEAVVITTTLYVTPQPIIELVARVRAHHADVPIIIGGPYIIGEAKQLDPDAFEAQLHYLGGDIYVISAEGEETLAAVLDALKRRGDLSRIPNLAYRSGRRFVRSEIVTEYNDLADNMIDYSLFARSSFGRFATIRTAKSCPFSCAFCGFPERAGKYTYLDVEHVERELDAIAKLGGVSTLTIIDDTFNVPKKRFKELLRLMIRKQYGFRWNSFYRCDHGDEETIELMAQAGCEGVILGTESGSDTILALMNKAARRRHYMAAIPRLEGLGIACYASFIVGFPGETFETVQETISLLEEARPSYYRAQLWYADPITPIFRNRLLHGLRGTGFNWAHKTMAVDEACDHIDRMFLRVDGSIWQPQAGFEFWSTFYLQRKGMAKAQVKAFLRAWNGAIRDKLVSPDHPALTTARVEQLREFARLEDLPASLPVDVSSDQGAAYDRAERFLVDELSTPVPDPTFLTGTQPWQWSELVTGGPPDSARVTAPFAAVDGTIAALAALLFRLYGVEDLMMVVTSEAGDLPIRLQLDSDSSFADLVHQARSKRTQAELHGRYAASIMTNAIRLAYLGAHAPTVRVSICLRSATPSQYDDGPPTTALRGLARGLGVGVDAWSSDSRLLLRVGSRFGSRHTAELGSALECLLEGAWADPARAVGQLPLGDDPLASRDESEATFQFDRDSRY